MTTMNEVVQNGHAWATETINTLNEAVTRLQHESNVELEKYRAKLKVKDEEIAQLKLMFSLIEPKVNALIALVEEAQKLVRDEIAKGG